MSHERTSPGRATSGPVPPIPPRGDAIASAAALRSRLRALRARLVRIAFVGGLGRLLLVAAALTAGSLAADRLLDLPLGVRRFVRLGLVDRPDGLGALLWLAALAVAAAGFVATARRGLAAAAGFAFVLAGVPGVCVFVAWRVLARPLARRASDERLAADVEHRHTELEERLLASLDFEGELASPSRGESEAFMAATVARAERDAESIRFAAVAKSGRAFARLGLALGAVGALTGVAAAMPQTTGIWWRRSALLEDVSWPRATTLVVVATGPDGVERPRDPAVPIPVPLGGALTVRVRAEGTVPDDVEILDRTTRDGPEGRPLARRMRVAAGAKGLFEHEFRDVRGDFEFFARGGDDRDDAPVYRVVVRVPPRVTDVHADLELPAYLASPPRRVTTGGFSVPEGTTIVFGFGADAPLSGAEVFVDDAPVPVAIAGELRTFRVEATKSFRWRVRITTTDGRENDPATDAWEVAVEPDVPAKPEWVWPRGPIETTPDGRVPLFAVTRDDHGVRSLAVEVEVAGGPVTSLPLKVRTADTPGEANDRPYGAVTIRSYVPLDLETLRDAAGARLSAPRRIAARIVATDTKGQTSAGPWTPVDLVRPDEVERSFSGRRTSLKSDLEGIRAELRKIRAETGSPADVLATEPEKAALRDAQYRLGRLRSDVERASRGVAGLFQAQVYGRIGAASPVEKILAILDRRHRDTFVEAPDGGAAGGAPTARGAEGGDDEVFPWALYADVGRARRDRRIPASDALDRLLDVLDASVACAADLAPALDASAATAARTGAKADVEALLAAEDRLEAGVGAVLEAMAQWQSLAELTLFVRRLIDEQESVRGGIKTLPVGAPK